MLNDNQILLLNEKILHLKSQKLDQYPALLPQAQREISSTVDSFTLLQLLTYQLPSSLLQASSELQSSSDVSHKKHYALFCTNHFIQIILLFTSQSQKAIRTFACYPFRRITKSHIVHIQMVMTMTVMTRQIIPPTNNAQLASFPSSQQHY